MTHNPSEAPDYLRYLKFLAIKGTRVQTKATLALDQDYRATKSRENFTWVSNVDDLSAQYFYAAVVLCPTPTSPSRSTDGRDSTSDEFFSAGILALTVALTSSPVSSNMCAFIARSNTKVKLALASLVLLAARNRKNDFLHAQKAPVIRPACGPIFH